MVPKNLAKRLKHPLNLSEQAKVVAQSEARLSSRAFAAQIR
jgi:hypothetical protein